MNADNALKATGFGFSPFSPAVATSEPAFRIGVPGYELYPPNWRILLLWRGSSFHMVFSSPIFLFYMCLLAFVVSVFSAIEYTAEVKSTVVPPGFSSAMMSVCIFMLTFFIGQCFSLANRRFENVCNTNCNVTRLIALAAGLMPQDQAHQLMRYINTIMHIYYFLLSGPLDDDKWSFLQRRGLMTTEEIKALQRQGSPAVVVYSWALKVMRSALASGDATSSTELFKDLLQPIEEQFGITQGFAAKQLAYTMYQIPSVYVHIVHVAINIYIICTMYDSGHAVAKALSGPCGEGSVGDYCAPAIVTVLLTEFILVVFFLGLMLTAEGLNDFLGNQAFHYDLGFDLDSLWQESQNVLKSMNVECPSITTKAERDVCSLRGAAAISLPGAVDEQTVPEEGGQGGDREVPAISPW